MAKEMYKDEQGNYIEIDVVDIEDFKKEKSFKEKAKERFYFAKKKAKESINKGVSFVETHPIIGGMIISAGLKMAVAGYKGHQRTKCLRAEENARLTTFYDDRMRHHVKIRRPLTQGEMLRVDQLRKAGKCYTEIFAEMRLL